MQPQRGRAGSVSERSRRRAAAGGRAATALCTGAMLALAACAPTQAVWLDLGPDPPVLYVDGVEWPETPERLELRADRDHTLFFRQPGHRSQMRVLESVEGEAGPELRPDTLRVRLLPIAEGGRAVEVELEEPAAGSVQPQEDGGR